jgi:branched-chain amino acid transport system substrate-binding protein
MNRVRRDLSVSVSRWFWLACVAAGLLAGPVLGEAVLAEPVIVAGPATGRHAATLPAMAAGARKAAEGTPTAIEEVDDGCDAARATGAARVIAAGKPGLVIGHPCPAAAIAAARVYADAGILFIALGVRHPALTEQRAGPSIFRFAGREDRQGEAAADALIQLAPSGRIAIVQDRTAYARRLTAAVSTALSARKLAPPMVIPIVAGRRDYGPDLAKLKLSPPDAIFFAGYPPEAAVVLRGLSQAGFKGPVVASDANATEDFAAAADAASGISQPPVKVMVPAAGSGGLDGTDLERAAEDAVRAWLAARATGDAARALANGPIFDDRGDARIPAFRAVPLVDGRWANKAGRNP